MSDWQQRAATMDPDGRAAIGGARVESRSDTVIGSVNPADEEILWELPACSAADIDDAVAAARRAFENGSWSTDRTGRRAAMRRFADELDRRCDELALLDTLEIGIPVATTIDDVALAADHVRFCAESIEYAVDDLIPSNGLVLNVREPRGVVGLITPWNFPFFVAVTKVAAALAAGNTIVLKPSELGSMSALVMADAAASADIPPGVVNVVPGHGRVAGAALGRHRDVDFIGFTGSTVTGRELLRLSAESNLKSIATELGGKSPQIVFAGCRDLEGVAASVVQSIFWNSGQVCTAGSRLLVHDSLHDDLLASVVACAADFVPGDPLDPATTLGPLASADQLARVIGFLERNESGRVVCGGRRSDRIGYYVEPTIVDGVEPGTELFREEVFGPVLAVSTFATFDEAVELANATSYGLSATAWTDDLTEAVLCAQRLRAGFVTVNPGRPTGAGSNGGGEPFGASGSGIEGGLRGVQTYQRVKLATIGIGVTV